MCVMEGRTDMGHRTWDMGGKQQRRSGSGSPEKTTKMDRGKVMMMTTRYEA